MKIDVFAHVMLPNFYEKMTRIDDKLLNKMPFLMNPTLTDMSARQTYALPDVKQIISYVNVNPEDYVDEQTALELVEEANQELLSAVMDNNDQFYAGVAMLALNNIAGSVKILENFVALEEAIIGVQLFTRHLGRSIADPLFLPIFEKCAQLNIPIFLHPVFDERKPDNNIVFSWEYELTQAMYQLVEANIFQQYPDLKIIVHHAGAMAPYFAGRITHILSEIQVKDFKKFYVDTAILGNSKALELAIDYYGVEHVLFGTDAPLGIVPAGANKEIIAAIEALPISTDDKTKIFSANLLRLLGR